MDYEKGMASYANPVASCVWNTWGWICSSLSFPRNRHLVLLAGQKHFSNPGNRQNAMAAVWLSCKDCSMSHRQALGINSVQEASTERSI
jgi:hypothetical protein